MNYKDIFNKYSNKEIAQMIYDEFVQDESITRYNVRKKFQTFESSFWAKHQLNQEFLNWIKNLIYNKSGDYKEDRDYLLFIAPEYTPESQELLQNHNVACLKYSDPLVERLIEEVEEEIFKGLTEEEKKIVGFINETKSKGRTYDVVVKKFPNLHILEELVRKNKVKIKKRKDKNYIHIVKLKKKRVII